MFWLRSAAIYLVLTAVFLGAVWLFWGKEIETAWKKYRVAEKIPKEIPKEVKKEIAKKKAELKKVDIPTPTVPAAIQQLPANAAAEWQKTRSGVAGLVEVQKHENLRDMQTLAGKQESRMIEILKFVKLYKEPKPVFVPAAAPVPAKPDKTTAPVKKEKTKSKAAPLRPML